MTEEIKKEEVRKQNVFEYQALRFFSWLFKTIQRSLLAGLVGFILGIGASYLFVNFAVQEVLNLERFRYNESNYQVSYIGPRKKFDVSSTNLIIPSEVKITAPAPTIAPITEPIKETKKKK